MTSTPAVSISASAAATLAFATQALPFDGFVFFSPIVQNYTGQKKLRPEDIGLTAKQLPPDTLAKLGTIASCDPSKLQKFESFRAAQRNALLKHGTRSMGMFAVPAEHANEAAQTLDEITTEFYAYKTEFLAEFDADRAKWLADPEFAQWVSAIRARLDPVGHIEKKIQCDWFGFTIGKSKAELSDDTSKALAAGLDRAKSALGNQAFDEIAGIANTVFEKSLHDDSGNKKVEVTQKILSPIRRIKEKLSALAFADPRMNRVIAYIDSVLCLLPKEGKLSNNNLMSIFNLISLLKEPEQLLLTVDAIATSTFSSMTADDAQQVLDIVQSSQTVVQVDATPVVDDLNSSGSTPTASAATVETHATQPAAVVEVASGVVYDDL